MIKTMQCGHCKRMIKPESWEPLYRTCDSWVCSPACSRERVKVISRLDPNLHHCASWANTTTINPPKTLEKKSSYIALSSLSNKTDRVAITSLLITEGNDLGAYEQTEYDVENNYITIDNSNNCTTPIRNILHVTKKTLEIVCVSVITVGVIIMLG